LIVILVGVFVAVAAVAGFAASAVLSSAAPERRRLFASTNPQGLSTLPELMPLASDSSEPDAWQRLGSILPRSKKDMSKLRLRMQRAGFRHPSRAATIYSFIELVMPFVAAGAGLLLLTGQRAYFGAAIGAAAMFFGPGLVVERRLASRRREIENGLPDALDLLVVCIEAGSGLDQAIVKTAEELTVAYPNLAEELRILTAEIRAGKPRLEAFKGLAARTRVDDVRALIQTDKFGTSVGQALRTHADVSRTKRRQRAEERAQKVGVKLVFPLVLCFFPALYVVLLGPAVIQFMHEFMHK
jgi:tight adherence protein C